MAWNYAELSKAAKAFGGPEKLMDHVVATSKKAGRIEMIPVVGGAIVAAVAITKAIDNFKEKKKAIQAELEATKTELIDGIKEYDASHPETVLSETTGCEAEDQCEPEDK